MTAEWVSVSAMLAVTGIGAVVWLVRLEGRVDKNEAKHAGLETRHNELLSDVKYIRQRIDEALDR